MEELMPKVVQTYLEVVCHFNICMDLHDQRKDGILFAKWAKYLITDMKFSKVLKPSALAAVEHRLNKLEKGRESTYTPSCAEGNLAEGITFQSYHY